MVFVEPLSFLVLMWGFVALDGWLGDPVYRFHPIRLIGDALLRLERLLFRAGLDGTFGGVVLGVGLVALALGCYGGLRELFGWFHPWLSWSWDLWMGYSLFALRDLERHGQRVLEATEVGNLAEARHAVSMLVGRDVDRMDLFDCNRATVESLSENVCDGVIAPLFWFAVGGIPAMLVFKVVSTMDSMVGYRNERYLHFGWLGARADDAMNFLPARLTWVLLSVAALGSPQFSGRDAWRVGWQQHQRLPGPNAGWAQAAAAGALQVRLVGNKWKRGTLQLSAWVGRETDPTDVTSAQLRQMIFLNRWVTLLLLTCLTTLRVAFF